MWAVDELPGRCPGLLCCGPFGAKSRRALSPPLCEQLTIHGQPSHRRSLGPLRHFGYNHQSRRRGTTSTTHWFPTAWRKWLMPAPSCCLWLLSVMIAAAPPPRPAPEAVTLRGKVMTLTAALKARGLDVAPDP